MAAEEFVLIPKHTYIREQPHASQVLFNSSIKHKKPQLSYLNRMRPLIPTKQNSVSTETLPLPLPPTPPSTPIVDPGEQSTDFLQKVRLINIRKVGRKRRSGLWMRRSERIIK